MGWNVVHLTDALSVEMALAGRARLPRAPEAWAAVLRLTSAMPSTRWRAEEPIEWIPRAWNEAADFLAGRSRVAGAGHRAWLPCAAAVRGYREWVRGRPAYVRAASDASQDDDGMVAWAAAVFVWIRGAWRLAAARSAAHPARPGAVFQGEADGVQAQVQLVFDLILGALAVEPETPLIPEAQRVQAQRLFNKAWGPPRTGQEEATENAEALRRRVAPGTG